MVIHLFRVVCLLLPMLLVCPAAAEERSVKWVETAAYPAEEAKQGAAADEHSLYAIGSRVIARYDRATGRRLSLSHGTAHHLNSGFFLDGKLYCAHSNFPQKPECSEIKVLDPESMELTEFHSFGETARGSLTVALVEKGCWWCVFAVYGKEDNGRTVLVKYDPRWNEEAVFTFPESVIADLGASSISGGIWMNDEFLATGHDKKVIYRLGLPKTRTVLEHRETEASPFPGQAIAIDPLTHGLIGIHRKEKKILFAERQTAAK